MTVRGYYDSVGIVLHTDEPILVNIFRLKGHESLGVRGFLSSTELVQDEYYWNTVFQIYTAL